MRTAAVIVAVLGLVLRTIAAGWVFIGLGATLYLPACIAHVVVHFRALGRENSAKQVRLAAISNCLFLAAFLLQLDLGDGADGWMTITGLIYRYSFAHPAAELRFSPDMGVFVFVDLLVFAPVVISWVLMLKQRTRSEQGTHDASSDR